jgi:hypothetical protein
LSLQCTKGFAQFLELPMIWSSISVGDEMWIVRRSPWFFAQPEKMIDQATQCPEYDLNAVTR